MKIDCTWQTCDTQRDRRTSAFLELLLEPNTALLFRSINIKLGQHILVCGADNNIIQQKLCTDWVLLTRPLRGRSKRRFQTWWRSCCKTESLQLTKCFSDTSMIYQKASGEAWWVPYRHQVKIVKMLQSRAEWVSGDKCQCLSVSVPLNWPHTGPGRAGEKQQQQQHVCREKRWLLWG